MRGTGGRRARAVVAVLVLGSAVATGGACGDDVVAPAGDAAAAASGTTLAPMSMMPAFPPGTSDEAVTAYRYAVANPDALRYIPCYCGCGETHESNLDCYVDEVHGDGTVTLDGHGVF